MFTKGKSLRDITAGDLMSRNVVLLPQGMPLRDAALLLRRARVSGAPVVDEQGRCIGVLSAADFLRWAEQQGHGVEDTPLPACPYQVRGRLLTGEEAVVCVLAEGICPLQVMRPGTGGRHTAVCTLASEPLRDGPRGIEDLPGDSVRRYMTADIVTAAPETSLPRLARMMVDVHIHRILVLDPEQKPVGIVSSTDLLAALAQAGDGQGTSESTLPETTGGEGAGSMPQKGVP